MTITVTEKFTSRHSSHSNGVKRETRVYGVKCSEQPAGLSIVRDAEGIPAYGAALSVYSGNSADAYTVCTSKDVSAISGTDKHFEVRVDFETSTGDGGTEIEDPLLRPIEVEVQPLERTAEYFWDTAGNAVATSAGEPFESQLTRDVSDIVLVITRNESTSVYNPITYAATANTLNASTQTICGITFAARKCRMKPISAAYVIEDQYRYWRVTYSIIIPVSDIVTGWSVKVADQGYYKLVSNKRTKILDPHNMMYSRPYPLDGAGSPRNNGDEAPAILSFYPYAAADWSILNLPTNLP
jgi:hypothetical protein